MHRDHNAARQILAKGLKSTAGQTESKGNPQNSPIQSANFEGTLKACGQNDLYLGGETPLDKSTG
ncbi:hypothetical protein CEN46_22850 [Fischerella thermalis CCMEE 5318]|uniref:Uncharacterized protein n=1 Tax=Fischerella thermalis CCMEE 5318 TaxID=2019666 RepID=A0A2N6L6W1_9CYAN|nr:hypothetical protein CEN46_22850 [Fischerella thermalis CCMEE 5318]